MTRYEREANAGPHSARKALNYAETDAQIAKHTAFKHTLKGTFRRGIGRMAETGQSMKNKVQKAGQNIKNKVETSETLKKVYGNIKPEMEKAKERTTRGMEKVGQAYQKMDTEGRDLVKQYLPNELNRYLKGGDITRAILRRRAKAKRNQAMTPQQQPVQTNQPVPQLAYNKQGQKMLPKLEGLDISRKVLMHYTRNRI
jgi:gas vesicle protein